MAEITLERKIQLLLETQLNLLAAKVVDGSEEVDAKPKVVLPPEDLDKIERIARISKILRMKAEVGADAVRIAQKVNEEELLRDLRATKDPEIFPNRGRPKGPRPKVGDDASEA